MRKTVDANQLRKVLNFPKTLTLLIIVFVHLKNFTYLCNIIK